MPRICIFGASTTWGRIDSLGGGWVDRLKKQFFEGDNLTQVYNLGISGNNTNSLLSRFESECIARLKPKHKSENLIIFSIGSNDSKLVQNKYPLISRQAFIKNIKSLISISRNFASRQAFTGLTPVDESKTKPVSWNKEAFYQNDFIEKYNGLLKDICKKERIPFLDIFSLWSKMNYVNLLYDGLHPNKAGHELLYQQVLEFLKKEKFIQLS